MRLIGLLGGTFNPIHNGHLHLAECLLQQLRFDEIRFIPNAVPALKDLPEVSAQNRAQMIKLAIADHPKFTLDTRELAREGKSYTVDTLQGMRTELGQAVSLCLLMGYDAFLGLPKWHRWRELLHFAHIVVVNRPQSGDRLTPELANFLQQHQTDALEALLDAPSGAVFFARIPPLDISSSEIRKRLASQQPIDALLPASIFGYIQAHHLYGA